MELQVGTTQVYNNEIVIANKSQDLGLNNEVIIKPVPPKPTHNVQRTPTKQSHSNLDYRQKVTVTQKLIICHKAGSMVVVPNREVWHDG